MDALKFFINILLRFTLLLILIIIFIPFSPRMPGAGIDLSWILGLNQAVSQGLSFGRQIIFSLGPYSSIFTKAYHPDTYTMMIFGSLYLTLGYWLVLIVLLKESQWRWIIALSLFLLGMIEARDALFFSYPLLVGLLCYKIAVAKDNLLSKYTVYFLGIAFSPLGLLGLIKASFLILSGIITLLSFVFLILQKKKLWAFLCLIMPLVSMSVFWVAAGQDLAVLPLYLRHTLSLSLGFTEAMSLASSNDDIFLYLLSSILILGTILCQKIAPISRVFLFSLYAAFLLIAFKTGFTRHLGHGLIAGTAILMAPLFLPYLFQSRVIYLILLVSWCTCNTIDSRYTHRSIKENLRSTINSAWYGLRHSIENKDWLKTDFMLSLHFLHQQCPLPALPGTTDIFSYNQSYLIASNNHWFPRPTFQSYSVFNAMLAEQNKHYFLSKNSPDNIFFKVEPIDTRIPSLEDGSSWPVLLTHYKPVQWVSEFLWLQKKEGNRGKLGTALLSKEVHELGEEVIIPDRHQFIWVQIEINPSIWGKLANLFYKPSTLSIVYKLKNGLHRQYRIIPSMARSEFLLSPLVESSAEFALLYEGEQALNTKQVESFRITAHEGFLQHWNPHYSIAYTLQTELN